MVNLVAGNSAQESRRLVGYQPVHWWERGWVRQGVLPLVFYTAATLILTLPLATRLTTHAAGAAYGDAFESVRLIWWTKEAILQGMHPAQQPLLQYPDGFFSAVQWVAPLSHLAGLPFALVFSPLVAYNLTFLLAFVLTGWASYWFFRELTGHEGAALLGGLIVLAFPTRLGHAAAGHLGLITNYWRMLFLWSLLKTFRGAGWRAAALGGLFLGLTLGTAPTNIAYEVIPLLAVVGAGLAWQARLTWGRWVGPLMIMAGVAGLIAVVLYLPLLLEMMRGDSAFLAETGTVRYSTDLLAFGLPSPFNPVAKALGLVSQTTWDVLGDNAIEGSAYLGLVAVFLAMMALRRREARLWLILALVSMVSSLGPVLKVGDRVARVTVEGSETTAITLPYAVYDDLPGLSMARTPARFNLMTAVALAALAAYGWAAFSTRRLRLRSPLWQGGAVIGLAALVIIEYGVFVPFPTTEAPVAGYFEELAVDAAQGDVRPVLTLPAGEFFASQWLLFDQTIHHQPVITGHVVRKTAANPAMLTLVNAAALPAGDDGFLPVMSAADQVGIIRASGAEVVVVYREYGEGAAMAAHLATLFGAPAYEDARVSIYEVMEGPLPTGPVYTVEYGWPAEDSSATRWIADEMVLSVYLPEARTGRWRFNASPWLFDRWLALELDRMATDMYGLDAGADAITEWVSSPYGLRAGFQQARFAMPDYSEQCTRMPGEADCRSAWIGTPRLEFDDEDQAPGAIFGDKMRLVWYAIDRDDPRQLALTLYWQAQGAARADYTLFVHILDGEGALVAQWDGPPAGAEYPTSEWPQGGYRWQRVTIALPEGGLPPGAYTLSAGLYTFPDMTRLPISGSPSGVEQGRLYLDEWTIEPSGQE